MTERHKQPEAESCKYWVPTVLERLAREIQRSEGKLKEFQQDLAEILGSAQVSESDIRKIQILDHTTQAIGDLSLATWILSRNLKMNENNFWNQIEHKLRLHDVKLRIIDCDSHAEFSNSNSTGDVNFFSGKSGILPLSGHYN